MRTRSSSSGKRLTAVKSAILAVLLFFAAPAAQALMISEVMFNPSGGDNGREWIELFNETGAPVDLANYSLGWGGADYTVGTTALSGIIGSGQYFVIGGPTSDAGNGNPTIDLVVNFSPNIENAFGGTADGVALFDVPVGSITAVTVPLDAVIYGWATATNSSGLMDATGNPGAIDVTTGMAGGVSIERSDLGWALQNNPSPGGGIITPVPAPATILLMLLGLGIITVHRAPVAQRS
jgi:hypothetical protein